MMGALRLSGLVIAALFLTLIARPLVAHEGHDHDKPPPLNLPVAPRVVAVTPQLELVGVVSGEQKLTVFLHDFATNAPIAGARMEVSSEDGSVDAKPDGDGVFIVTAPWLTKVGAAELIFALQFADGSEDLLTGSLEVPDSRDLEANTQTGTESPSWELYLLENQFLLWAIGGSFVAGVLLTLLVSGGRHPSGTANHNGNASSREARVPRVSDAERGAEGAPVTPLRRSAGVITALIALLASHIFVHEPATAVEAATQVPSVPSTMATDQPQRMPDATLFVPKATQHLLSIRTQIATRRKAARSTELSGRVIAGPQNFGRVQSNRPGRFQAAEGSVPYIGMRVEKGQVLGVVETYVEESDLANIVSEIAETEALIVKNRTILSRYLARPGSVPKVREDEVRGQLEALIKKRENLLPITTASVRLVAPISGVISAANAVVGQVVETRDVLFEIIDPSQFWIEAVAPHPEIANDLAWAVATVHDHHKLNLEYIGRGLALRHHSTILNFKVNTPDEELAVGMTARVILQSKDQVEGFVLPSSAVVRGRTGLPIVWIKTEPERFEPQLVNFAPFDGDRVVVTAGLKEDQRIVVDGVTLLNQVR